MARKMAQERYEEVVGPLYLAFLQLTKTYDDSKGKFSSYFCRYAPKLVIKFVREDWDYFDDASKVSVYDLDDQVSFQEHERRVEGGDYDFFADQNVLDEMRKLCEPADRELFDLLYVKKLTGRAVGVLWRVSRERVRQRKERMLRRIRERFEESREIV